MKPIILFGALGLAAWLGMVISACEKHKDPFSANNAAPVIASFAFKPDLNLPDRSLRADGDSLKYKKDKAYPLALVYSDAEAQKSGRTLRANFKFLTGSGKISSNKFTNPGSEGLAFDIPAQFNDEILLIPEKAGIVDLQLQITDGVKESPTMTATTTFFVNLPPIVRFNFSGGNQQGPPYGLDFNAAASVDRDSKIETYTWSFGDGSSSVTVRSNTIHHDYQGSGTFTVRLKVTDDEGVADSLDQAITTANQAPVAVLSVTPTAGKTPLSIKYDARGSRDRDGRIVSYDISFGDGKSSQSDTGSHRYTTDAVYPLRLTVKDNVGADNTTTVTITVATPPIAVLKVLPDSGAFPLSAMLDGSGSFDPLGGQIVEPQIFINDQPIYNLLSAMHIFRSPGDFRVALQVRSSRNRDLLGRDEKTVRAINLPPVANFTWTRDLGNVTFTSTSVEPNAPDDRLTNYSWNFGDSTDPQSGSNLSTVTHTYLRSGDYIVQLTVTDSITPPLTGVKRDTVEVR